jgi:hypothetical protein
MVTQEEVEEPYNNDFHASNSKTPRDAATAWTGAPPKQVARASWVRYGVSKTSTNRNHAGITH